MPRPSILYVVRFSLAGSEEIGQAGRGFREVFGVIRIEVRPSLVFSRRSFCVISLYGDFRGFIGLVLGCIY